MGLQEENGTQRGERTQVEGWCFKEESETQEEEFNSKKRMKLEEYSGTETRVKYGALQEE